MRSNPCVLLVDDDANMRRLIATTLDAYGYDVIETASGREAMQTIENVMRITWDADAIDLVLAEVRVPGMTGIALLDFLRRANATIPFVLMTAFPDRTLYDLASSYGVTLLEKPFSLERLRRVVHDEMLRIRPAI